MQCKSNAIKPLQKNIFNIQLELAPGNEMESLSHEGLGNRMLL
jgi:hypothetical protein